MGNRKVRLLCILIMVTVCCVASDFTQDKKKCQNQLLRLSPCLDFVRGDAKAPTSTCCSELGKDIGNTLCLCILVRDRNEPGLGFKLNATLALSLPSMCHVSANASSCPALLHLAPNSPDAQVFKQVGGPSANGNRTSSRDTSTSSSTNSKGKGQYRPWTAAGVSVWLVIAALIGDI